MQYYYTAYLLKPMLSVLALRLRFSLTQNINLRANTPHSKKQLKALNCSFFIRSRRFSCIVSRSNKEVRIRSVKTSWRRLFLEVD